MQVQLCSYSLPAIYHRLKSKAEQDSSRPYVVSVPTTRRSRETYVEVINAASELPSWHPKMLL